MPIPPLPNPITTAPAMGAATMTTITPAPAYKTLHPLLPAKPSPHKSLGSKATTLRAVDLCKSLASSGKRRQDPKISSYQTVSTYYIAIYCMELTTCMPAHALAHDFQSTSQAWLSGKGTITITRLTGDGWVVTACEACARNVFKQYGQCTHDP